MSDTSTRKPVITTVQVQEALDRVNANYKTLDPKFLSFEFDKGARGKGFALYTASGDVARSFDTKEDALVWANTFADGMVAVMSTLPKPKTTGAAKATENNAA